MTPAPENADVPCPPHDHVAGRQPHDRAEPDVRLGLREQWAVRRRGVRPRAPIPQRVA